MSKSLSCAVHVRGHTRPQQSLLVSLSKELLLQSTINKITKNAKREERKRNQIKEERREDIRIIIKEIERNKGIKEEKNAYSESHAPRFSNGEGFGDIRDISTLQ